MKKYFVLGALLAPQISSAMIDKNNSDNFLKDDNGNVLQYCKTYYLDANDAIKIKNRIGYTIGRNTQMITPNNEGMKNIKFYLEAQIYQHESEKYPIEFYPENNIYSTYCENEKLNSFKTYLVSTAEFIKKNDYIYFQLKKYPTHYIENRTNNSSENNMKSIEERWKQSQSKIDLMKEESNKKMKTMIEESNKKMKTMLEESNKRMDELKKKYSYHHSFN